MYLGTQVDLRNDEATLLKLAKRKEKPISNTLGKNLATVSRIKNLFKRMYNVHVIVSDQSIYWVAFQIHKNSL